MESSAPTASKCRHCAPGFAASSIGKKILVAAAGLLLVGFLAAHLAGNLLLFAGEEAFNRYAELLEESPLLPLAEAGLAALFAAHIALSLKARLANRAARPRGYEVYRGRGARTTGSRTMAASGLLLAAFLVVHVGSFKFRWGGSMGEGLFAHVTGWFSRPLYAAFYVAAMFAVGLHLSHGVQSAAQTLGLGHPRYAPWARRAGLAAAALLGLGFASIPLYFGFLKCLPCGGAR